MPRSKKITVPVCDRTRKLIDFLAKAADAEQVRLHPLPIHRYAEYEEHIRHQYALILAALLSAQPQVSETQSRLLLLLLNSMRLGDIRAALFEQARELEPDALLEAIREVRGCCRSLLIDGLVLLRLDAPLSEDTVRLVCELAALYGIPDFDVAEIAQTAADILGVGKLHDLREAPNWPREYFYEREKKCVESEEEKRHRESVEKLEKSLESFKRNTKHWFS